MTQTALIQVALYLSIILMLVKPLGWYIAQVYLGKSCGLDKIFSPLEKLIARCCGVTAEQEMDWKQYLAAMLMLNFCGLVAVYLLQRVQFYLPLNPQAMPGVAADLAFNSAVSFVTNTNWQAYSGEASMSYFTQSIAFTVQNFISAATAMSLAVAFIRGLVRYESTHLGNFWIDTIRGVLYILLPLSLALAVILGSQGVIQNYKAYQVIKPFAAAATSDATQTIPMGPVASQVAIKQLGSNGGGFFNSNSAHPFENPTPLTNLLEMIAILLIPAAFCYTFGVMINDRRQGWALLAAMLAIFICCCVAMIMVEEQGNPAVLKLHIEANGNMEGKETRFGVISSSIWATATAAASHGSVNAMLDSFAPLGGLIALFLMHLGGVVFGSVGCGLYGMLMLVILTVFVAGLMVGRTPEYLGKKIEPFEMKMAVVAVIIMPILVLPCTSLAVLTPIAVNAVGNPGAHGFTEIIYAFSSLTANNGSAFSGLQVNNQFYNILGGLVMLLGRYWPAIATLAVAGSLARKKLIPVSPGTLATHTPLFVMLLIGVTIIIGALSFLPGLSLGPIVEHLMLWSQNAS